MDEVIMMCWPTGPKKLEVVRASGFKRWRPRLPEQPICYPVTNEEYAAQIARDWDVKDSGAGYVTHLQVRKAFMDRYGVQTVGLSSHTEWWLPADDLEEMNQNLIGLIEVIQEFKA